LLLQSNAHFRSSYTIAFFIRSKKHSFTGQLKTSIMKINFTGSFLGRSAAIFLFALSLAATAFGQTNAIATAAGEPSLSGEMVDQYRTVYEFLLEIKLNPQQKTRLQNGLMQYWEQNNAEAITQTVGDLKYYGKKDELESLRNSSQKILVEAFRRDANDSVSKLFIEAYDAAHPDRVQSTKTRTFEDLIGNWKRSDGLIAEKSYDAQAAGVSYTESETIEISADGKFKHMKVHSHYSGACSEIDGKTEYGKIRTDGTRLIFEILSGTEMVKNACAPSLNQQEKIMPRKETFPWVIKTEPDNNNILTLCWNTTDTTAVCFEKE